MHDLPTDAFISNRSSQLADVDLYMLPPLLENHINKEVWFLVQRDGIAVEI
jgi:hypothetical protein